MTASVKTLEQPRLKAPANDGAVELTILMPCLNEAETLAVCVQKARGFLERSGISGEILIADNGSTDGSQLIAEDNGARVVAIPERVTGRR
jgi:glycosyltransferase involved in cell wall biosynthesis